MSDETREAAGSAAHKLANLAKATHDDERAEHAAYRARVRGAVEEMLGAFRDDPDAEHSLDDPDEDCPYCQGLVALDALVENAQDDAG